MTDLVRAHLARERCELAISQLQKACAEVGVILGVEHDVYKTICQAREYSRAAYVAIDAQIIGAR
jgi:hypothetical protein